MPTVWNFAIKEYQKFENGDFNFDENGRVKLTSKEDFEKAQQLSKKLGENRGTGMSMT